LKAPYDYIGSGYAAEINIHKEIRVNTTTTTTPGGYVSCQCQIARHGKHSGVTCQPI
jgi:hypothetical protein